MTPTAFYVLGATVPAGNRIRGFFRQGRESPSWLLTEPETFRHSGFDVRTHSIASLVDNERWEIRSGDRKLLRMYQDGTLLFRMRADAQFLAWGYGQFLWGNTAPLNPVAVVEAHASFAYLYAGLLSKFMSGFPPVRFTLALRNAHVGGRRLSLSQYFALPYHVDEPQTYPVHDLNATATEDVGGKLVAGDPDYVSLELVSKFYDLFDAPAELIPFKRQTDDQSVAINIAAIQALAT